MRKINVLFLGGAKRVSLARHLIDAGRKIGCDIQIFSYELQYEVPIAAVGKVIIGERWNSPNIIEAIAKASEEYTIHIILPFVDASVEVAARLKQVLPNVFIPVSDENICRTMFDKYLSNKWFLERNIPVPQSYEDVSNVKFPIILKPRKGSASKGIKIATTTSDLTGVDNIDQYLIQEYIPNRTEYTVDCYVSGKGEIIAVVPRERISTAGGEVMSSKTCNDCVINSVSRQILSAAGFRGPITIQFLRNKISGETFVMEINPRLGGGVITSIEAGADITLFILTEFLGGTLAHCTSWKANTLMTRYYQEVMFYADNN